MVRRRQPQAVAASPMPRIPFGSPISRPEWFAIFAVVLLAAALRFAYPSRMAIEHFDEGVYASNIFFSGAEGGQYPYRHLYAPPLLPFLIEMGIIFLGPQSIAPFLPALILGTATVPLAWWAVRNWFGPLAGLAAAFLIATSDFHLLYSRTALTDVPVAFFMLLAVYLYWEAIRRSSLAWSAAAGVATGLAWWTKYTGWLPLAIALSGSIAWVITERRAGGDSLRLGVKNVTSCFATTALVAFLVWSPVLWYLQPYGGYAAVAENHRGYLRPLSDWGSNALEHAGQLAAQTGNLTVAGIAILGFLVPLLAKRRFAETVALEVCCSATLVWSVYEIGPALPLSVLAFGGVGVKLFSSLLAARCSSRTSGGAPLALWLLAAWLFGVTLTTPIYTPYSRLALPWVMAAITGTCAWFWNTVDIDPGPLFRMRSVHLFAAIVLLGLPAGVFSERGAFLFKATVLTQSWSIPGWRHHRGLEGACKSAANAIERDLAPRSDTVIVYVYETIQGPATFFHLASRFASQNVLVLPAGSFSPLLESPESDTSIYVVTSFSDLAGWKAELSERQTTQFQTQVIEIADVLFTFPSPLVILDDDNDWSQNQSALQVLKIDSSND